MPNLRKLNEVHLKSTRSAFGHFDVGFITKKHIRQGYILLDRYAVDLKNVNTKQSFVLTHKDKIISFFMIKTHRKLKN